MNYETGFADHQAGARHDDLTIDEESAVINRRRTIIVVAIVAIIIAALAGYYLLRDSSSASTAAGEGTSVGAGEDDSQAPAITVTVPGVSTVERIINATGTLAARREMPIGIAGEGGQVTRVLVQPGDWARQGQVLAVIDRAVQNEQARSLAAQVKVAQADATLAQNELDRALQLVDRGFISKADVDRRRATRDSSLARVSVAQAQLNEARARTGRLDIRAPESGLVLERNVEPGQVVSSGSGVLFRMAAKGEMELRARLSEGDLASLSVGDTAKVVPVGSDKSFQGRIWQLLPTIDPTSRQGIARIALPYDRALRPGGFASSQLVSGTTQAPMLPESAVLSDGKGSYVYIVDKDNKVARRDVETGTIGDSGIAITSGLNGRERVVLFAGGFLNPGETVRPTLEKKDKIG